MKPSITTSSFPKAGLRRQDAEANIGEADGLKGARQEPRVIQCLCCNALTYKALDSGFRRDEAAAAPE